MKTREQGVDMTPVPFLKESEIPIDREDLRLERGFITDLDVAEFAHMHHAEMVDGDLNTDYLSTLQPNEALVYKILHEEENELEELAGLIYLIKKGMEHGSLQIAYVVANEYQGEGIGKSSVGAVTQEIGEKYDLVAHIDHDNERSTRIVRGLGYFATGVLPGSFEPYYRPRRENKSKHTAA